MKKKLLFIFNPKSGKGLIKEHLVNIVDIMTKAGYKITIYPTQCQGDAIKKVRKNAKKYDLVVCSGGDGTLDEVVTGMEQSEVNVPIGYIPAGSTNDFACKVIGAARRDVSYRYIYLALLHAGHYLVECAVSAAAHYKVILLSIFPDLFYGISLTLCRINGDFVSGLCHDVHDIYQMLLYEPLA